jgi:hypothetical protein
MIAHSGRASRGPGCPAMTDQYISIKKQNALIREGMNDQPPPARRIGRKRRELLQIAE